MSIRKMALLGVICAVLTLGACMSMGSPMVFDENLPIEETAHIFIHPGLEITSYNGIPVPTKKNPMKHSGIESEWHNMILPSGEVEFSLTIGTQYGNTIYTGKDIPFSYTFRPSGDLLYVLAFIPNGGDNRNERGINIYKSKGTMYKAEDKIAFVPFPRAERAVLE